MPDVPSTCRDLIVILGDQLDHHSAVFDDFDSAVDLVWMAEVRHESTQVWSSKPRITMFLSAMRHFANELVAKGVRVRYRHLDEHSSNTLEQALSSDLEVLRPRRVRMVKAGEWRLAKGLSECISASGVPLVECADRHFYLDADAFQAWAKGRREFRLEHFYRYMRQREQILWTKQDGPEGGVWNFDAENRASFPAQGPGQLPAPLSFSPDPMTQAVIGLIESAFSAHPGDLRAFDWPVTAKQAEAALDDFVMNRLIGFGTYQDAMWTQQPWLYHARLSAAMNLKLLSPRRAVDAALQAYASGRAPLAAVEGFVRQILGWREFVRGVYWLRMPDFLADNALGATLPLPEFYWHGETRMHCLQSALRQTLDLGYAHHIQRLMVLGLYAQLLGVDPRAIHEWFLAVYVDAVEWVELPNVIGMSQYADGGKMTSKPYVASGRYVERMSNYCVHCRYRPELSVGEQACPITTLYWDFLIRHEARFSRHPRTAMQWRNLARKDAHERLAIQQQASRHRAEVLATSMSPLPD